MSQILKSLFRQNSCGFQQELYLSRKRPTTSAVQTMQFGMHDFPALQGGTYSDTDTVPGDNILCGLVPHFWRHPIGVNGVPWGERSYSMRVEWSASGPSGLCILIPRACLEYQFPIPVLKRPLQSSGENPISDFTTAVVSSGLKIYKSGVLNICLHIPICVHAYMWPALQKSLEAAKSPCK